MWSDKIVLIFFFCVVSVGQASHRDLKLRLRGQADDKAPQALASYQSILSNLDESTMQRIHQRYVMENTMDAEDNVRELQEDGSMSLSMSMSSNVATLSGETEEVEAISSKAEKKEGRVAKDTKSPKSTKAPKASKLD
jgi:hypothetical protein